MPKSVKLALVEEYAALGRALGNPHRLLLLEQIAQGERGVDALARATALSLANCSQHLQTLRQAGLVTSRRQGKAVIYALANTNILGLLEKLATVAGENRAEAERLLRELSADGEASPPISRDTLARRLKTGGVVVIDVRPAEEFAEAHIAGARNVPLDQLDAFIADHNGQTEVIAYCRGPYCIYAYQAVSALQARGIPARRLKGGLPEWRAEGRALENTDNRQETPG